MDFTFIAWLLAKFADHYVVNATDVTPLDL